MFRYKKEKYKPLLELFSNLEMYIKEIDNDDWGYFEDFLETVHDIEVTSTWDQLSQEQQNLLMRYDEIIDAAYEDDLLRL